jgi:glycerophosphoryl diester phosphodiesterase
MNSETVAEERLPLVHSTSGPALIAHGGGNSMAVVSAAVAAAADYVEVDLWVHNGRLEARHERRFFSPVPLLYEKWYLSRAPRSPFDLRGLFEAAPPEVGIFLDLKNGGDGAGVLVEDAVAAAGQGRLVVASSQYWPVLRALHRRLPWVRLFYSVDVQAKLDLFLSVIDRDPLPSGVSCNHTLLDRETVAALRDRGLAVVAWTVDDVERAAALAAMGVAGITTHAVTAVRERLARR